MQKYLDEINENTKTINDFIQVLFTETISKKGMVYVYDKGEEEKIEIPPFANVMKQKEYVEFYIFNKYKEVEDRKLSSVNAKSEKRFNDLAISEEGNNIIYKKISEMVENYSKYVEELQYRKYEIEEGEAICDFYSVMFEKTRELKKTLE